MKTSHRTTFATTLAVVCLGILSAGNASAETQWQKDHPRRTQVNARLAKQNQRITNEVKSGEITKSEASSLRSNDKAIRAEERAMAKQNGGHITKTEQKALNQQLNQNSTAIGK